MSRSSSRRIRQYVGLALVLLAFFGGLIGWSWALWTLEPSPTDRDTTEVVRHLSLESADEAPQPSSSNAPEQKK